MMRLVVERTLLALERVRRLAVEIGVVGEEAGIGQAEGGERRREIQLDAPGLSVTDIPRRVEIAVAQILDHDMFDEVGDVEVEEVDAANAPAAQAALIADVDAPRLFVAEFRITEGGRKSKRLNSRH